LDKTLEKSIPITKIQKLIGKRMLSSKQNKPCFYLELKADVTELVKMRPKLKKSLGIKITTNTFYIRALAIACEKYPLMAGRKNGDHIKISDSINIGFAINAPQGLVVPVVKDAHKKTLAEIAELEKLLTEKARSNKLTLDDMADENVALSNLGVYGIDSFLGIVPPPASTILSVGNIIRTIFPKDKGVAIGKLVSLTLAVDHRIANGDYAAQFLSSIKELLQNPEKIT
jgi:pyruvate dehydrogenase E2 component (dihydrolipoamide acetyltransferase)